MSHAELPHFFEDLLISFFGGSSKIFRDEFILFPGHQGFPGFRVEDEVTAFVHQGQIGFKFRKEQVVTQQHNGRKAKESPEKGIERQVLTVGVSQEHGEEVEKEVHQQLEGFFQRPVNGIADEVRQAVGEGRHGGEQIDEDDKQDDPQGIDPVTNISDNSAGLFADLYVEITYHDQQQGDEPGDGGLFEIAGEAFPILFEGIDGVPGAQHLEHGVMKGGKSGSGRHHGHGEEDEQDVRRDDSADAGHDAPE